MESSVFLAVTAHEMEEFLPERLAYMACHFSPYNNGLSNIPSSLPAGSILLLDDSMPVQEHDPRLVTEQLLELANRFSLHAVLLDFQNEPTAAGAEIAAAIAEALPCPVAVTEQYGALKNCPVFLAPPPVNTPLNTYLAPWLERGIFLEIAPDGLQITVTEQGAQQAPLPSGAVCNLQRQDTRLHCHYRVEVLPKKAVFTLHRTREDALAMADQALQLGVRAAVGLYQELEKR